MLKTLFSSFFGHSFNLEHASKEFTPKLLREYNESRQNGYKEIICYAPFKNIYFGHYGKATVCCYNRDFVIGQYPQQTIQEIWFSTEANHLRDIITKNNLDYGCQLCKHHILSKNFKANKAKQYDENQSNENLYPSVMEFELSNRCNLECTMCNGNFSSLIRQNRENLPPVPQFYDDAFIDQLEEFIPYLEEAKFYGGEPFLIGIYFKIWEKIILINPKVRISVQTNATVLNRLVKELMEKAKFHINISIDSLQKSKYESIRKNAKFERVMNNVKWFAEYCSKKQTFFGISACLMKTNYKEAPDFVRFSNENNAKLYFHFLSTPKKLSLENISKEQLLELHSVLSEETFPDQNLLEKTNAQHYFDTLKQIQYLIEQNDENLQNLQTFKEQLSTYVSLNTHWTNDQKEQKLNRVLEKLDLLEKEIANPDKINKVFSQAPGGKTAFDLLSSKPLETLIQMFNEKVESDE